MTDILLSTYNGEKFLREFIASLKNQSCRDFRLLVRDDGSADGTARLLGECLADGAVEARFSASSGRHLGVVGSFGELLAESRADRLFFADQDDLWHPGKVAAMLSMMDDAEARLGRDTPILLHTDLRVCDEHGKIVADSFVRRQKLSPRRNGIADLLVQNHVTGCAMMINGALKDRIRLPFTPHAICHDWYLGLLAAAFGRIVYASEPYVDYRVHAANVYGAPEYSAGECAALFKSGRKTLKRRLELTQAQARDFLAQYGEALPPEARRSVAAWGSIGELRKWRRVARCLKFGFRKSTPARTLGMWWAI